MRFGVTLGAAGEGRRPHDLAEMAALAEASGWDAVFLEDYLGYQGIAGLPTFDPMICLAAMASATTRVQLGLSVAAVPRRRPWELAAAAMTLDHLCGGRLILGVGSGDVSDPGFSAVGEPAGRRALAGRLDESLAIMDQLWSGAVVNHRGEHYTVSGLQLPARPVQRPRIRIWVGGNMLVPAVRRRLCRWDGSLAYKGPAGREQEMTPGDIRELLDLVRQARGTTDGYDVKISLSDPARLTAFAAAGATWANRWIAPGPRLETEHIIRQGPAH
jgi:Luciferase-like monooxygenase